MWKPYSCEFSAENPIVPAFWLGSYRYFKTLKRRSLTGRRFSSLPSVRSSVLKCANISFSQTSQELLVLWNMAVALKSRDWLASICEIRWFAIGTAIRPVCKRAFGCNANSPIEISFWIPMQPKAFSCVKLIAPRTTRAAEALNLIPSSRLSQLETIALCVWWSNCCCGMQ